MTGDARDLLHFVWRALRSWPASLGTGSSLAGMWVASGALLALAQGDLPLVFVRGFVLVGWCEPSFGL